MTNADIITTEDIFVKGAREHNLKNVDVYFPRNKFIVVTGVSGSGKSSLVIDTLFAEGQRRYVESLSSYARQFLMRMDKPDVDRIDNISPAIAVEQKTSTKNARSTVGTLTEIYDYLRILFARIGVTYSPISGKQVKRDRVQDVVDYILQDIDEGTRIQILAPVKIPEDRDVQKQLELLLQNGYNRVFVNDKTYKIDSVLEEKGLYEELIEDQRVLLVIDRLSIRKDDANDDFENRVADSVQSAFFESHGDCFVYVEDNGIKEFNNRFELDGMLFDEPTPNFFSFNNPFGACKKCEGFGNIIGIDDDLVIPNKRLSVYDDAVACWKGAKMKVWKERFIKHADEIDFPIHRPYKDLTDKEQEYLWEGYSGAKGIYDFFSYLEEKSYKIQYRVMLSRYRGRTKCPECKGTRIRKETNYVKIADHTLRDLLLLPIDELQAFFKNLNLSQHDATIAKRILHEVTTRLQFMQDVGLSYLTLNRSSATLSGGETQRMNLTRTLGSNLTDSLYILDEPSVGLHPKDTERLISVLKQLRDLGNTVIVVEHEEEMIRSADYLIDVGPLAGINGGEIVFQGDASDIGQTDSLTANYLTGELEVPVPKHRRKASNTIELTGSAENNLKDIDITIPLNAFTVVSGVSGSGKTTLIKKILYPALARELEQSADKPGIFAELKGDISQIKSIELIDQNPLGRSSRSNPVTYIKAYDAIRNLFADQQLSKIRDYKAGHFSFNVEGGRCEVCKGDGEQTIEMQFLADVHLVCEECNGKRFKDEILEVKWNGFSIYDVLNMSVDEALINFKDEPSIADKIQPLQDVGMGYVKLGQSSSTLSGGEAQRVKLASYLVKEDRIDPILFIFDEPTTGLHFDDVKKLLKALDSLIENGHTVLVIEHDIDVIKNADWLIELGPEGGKKGGHLVFQGQPEDIVNIKNSPTAEFLAPKLKL